ncbi:hypothetical protein KQX63_23820 [Rhodopseudomonas palustris]|uniref:hypothetical protein n=1 Tax=Rhodopseudomonas palustris TaxID=1076 RepID=UPI0021F2E8F3|nr:hypothetical protein [Rhodopseudomonas palustris]UYO44342.1 hypothetical protein KQX63_23820 [Rhodopseudomonas palustris]
MQAAFLICVTYPFLALFYEPNAHSLVAFLYIAGSCLPLLWAARYETEQPCDPIPSPSRLLFWSIVLLGFFNLLIIAHRVGVSPWELLSVNGISSTAKLSTVARYEQGARSGDPLIQALSLFLIYRLGAADKKAPLWMAGLAYLPLVFYTLLTTEKWVMFLGIAFFFTGLFTGAPFRAALRRAIGYGLIFLPLGAALAGGLL